MATSRTSSAVAFIQYSQDRLQAFLDGQTLFGPQPWQVSSVLSNFREPINYSLANGGKRIRPVMVYAAAHALNESEAAKEALDYAALAVELVHPYSLIHDDLPAMDDDDLRRGKPTLHKAFDEAIAILAGDGLQAHAFELLTNIPDLSDSRKVLMIKSLAVAAGPLGMVGGQFIDVRSTGSPLSLDSLQTMHSLKTGALIRAALALGAIAAEGSVKDMEVLDSYGRDIGLAFQVIDDILDVESDTSTLGKTQGKDQQANKSTYVTLMGIEGAKEEADRLLECALSSLDQLDSAATPLRDLATYIVSRDR